MRGILLYISNIYSILLLIQLVIFSCFSSTSPKRQFLRVSVYGISLLWHLQDRYIVQQVGTQYTTAETPSQVFPDPTMQDQGMTEVLGFYIRLNHRIMIRQRHCCRRVRLNFRHYLCHHLRCRILSLRRTFCRNRGQAWILK